MRYVKLAALLATFACGGGTSGLRVYHQGVGDAPTVLHATLLAVDALEDKGPWGWQDVERCVDGVVVRVRPTRTWEWHGGGVSGLAWGDSGVIEVGCTLSAIPHELAHIIHLRVVGTLSYRHDGWEWNGIDYAENAYNTRRREQHIPEFCEE